MTSKYSKYLNLTADIENIDCCDYEYNCPNTNTCFLCGCDCKVLYTTYLHDKKIKTESCYLCHIVVNFKRYHMGKMILVKSKKAQCDINKETMEYFNETENIIDPLKLDKSALLIQIKLYDFTELNNKKLFKNCVVFFTDNVIDHLVSKQHNFFIKAKPKQKKQNISYNFINMGTYELFGEELKELNNLLTKRCIMNNKISDKIQLSIDDKIKKAYKMIEFKKELDALIHN